MADEKGIVTQKTGLGTNLINKMVDMLFSNNYYKYGRVTRCFKKIIKYRSATDDDDVDDTCCFFIH